MPTIKVTDSFGLEFAIAPERLSSLRKYLLDPASLRLANLARLDQLPFSSTRIGVRFETPVSLGTEQAELKVGAGVSGGIAVFVPGPGPGKDRLFTGEHYGEPVTVAPDQAYVSLSLIVSLNAALLEKAFNLGFGFDVGSTATLTSYKRFSTRPAAPLLPDAIRETLQDFIIPGDLHDLEMMPEGAISTVEGTGKLKFSGKADLLTAVNPLASVALPVAGELKLQTGASVSVGAGFEIFCEYQVRVEKRAGGAVRLGYYKKRGSGFTVKASATAGPAARVGDTDLLSTLLGAISLDPINAQELKKAGLDDVRLGALQKTVKAAVDRKLELAAAFEFGSLASEEAAFLYDVELDTLDASGREAVHRALDGDLSLLTEDEEALPKGITFRRSILSELRRNRHTFKINLFGIYNLFSVTELLRDGSVTFDAVSGLTVLDKITATRVEGAVSTLDSDKVRKLLADFFLITAAYRGSRLQVGMPELKSSHLYFELHGKTNHQTMKDNLEIAEALKLITAGRKQELLDGLTDFGRTAVCVETQYDSRLCRQLFLDAEGRARREADYDRAGLAALALLVQPDDPDAYRRRPAEDEKLWERMKDLGQANFRQAFPDLDAVRLANIAGDYTLIRWWSSTMRETAELLEEVEQVPTHDPEDNRFKTLRAKFAAHLAAVVRRTQPRWGDPWGLVAMDLLVNRAAAASIQVTGPRLALQKARESAGAAA